MNKKNEKNENNQLYVCFVCEEKCVFMGQYFSHSKRQWNTFW